MEEPPTDEPSIPGHQTPMEEPPTDDGLSGGHCSRSGDYGCPAGTFDQEQGEDLMSSLFLHSESQSPASSLLSSTLPADWFAGLENFGDGQISPLDEVPFCIPAAVAEETNYGAVPAPLVATHGTGAGQFSSNFSLSSNTSNEFDEEEVEQAMAPWQRLLHQPMVSDGFSNTTTVRSYVDAVPPLVQQGTSAASDDLSHRQQHLTLLLNNPEAQPGGGLLQMIQQLRSIISSSQPLVIDMVRHAALAPIGLQGTLVPAKPRDQVNIAWARHRPIKSGDLRSGLQGLIFLICESLSTTKIVDLHAAWLHVQVCKNPCEDQNHATVPSTIGSSYLSLSSVEVYKYKCDYASGPLWLDLKEFASAWHTGLKIDASAWCTGLFRFGFKKEFAANLDKYAFRQVQEHMMRLRSPSSSNNWRSIVEQGDASSSGKRKQQGDASSSGKRKQQGDASSSGKRKQQGDASSSGKRKRKPLAPRSKVWNHFTKEVVEAQGGSMVTMAKCKHCPSELRADSASHGTNQLKRHIRSRHPEHAESL